jgi:hypothetical protein
MPNSSSSQAILDLMEIAIANQTEVVLAPEDCLIVLAEFIRLKAQCTLCLLDIRRN